MARALFLIEQKAIKLTWGSSKEHEEFLLYPRASDIWNIGDPSPTWISISALLSIWVLVLRSTIQQASEQHSFMSCQCSLRKKGLASNTSFTCTTSDAWGAKSVDDALETAPKIRGPDASKQRVRPANAQAICQQKPRWKNGFLTPT